MRPAMAESGSKPTRDRQPGERREPAEPWGTGVPRELAEPRDQAAKTAAVAAKAAAERRAPGEARRRYRGGGGRIGSGGTPGSGGSGGTPGTGGIRGSGGSGGSGGTPGSGGTGGAGCGPVCAIFCPYGNVPDANGCPTCKCNPPPACTATECGPGLGIPSQVCSNGTIAGPVCLRDPTGKCVWAIFTCPPPPPSACGSHIGTSACIADTTCAWLQPGCGDPALAAAGCYAKTSIDCMSDAQCATGQQCLKRVVNPCYDPTAMVTCGTCGCHQDGLPVTARAPIRRRYSRRRCRNRPEALRGPYR